MTTHKSRLVKTLLQSGLSNIMRVHPISANDAHTIDKSINEDIFLKSINGVEYGIKKLQKAGSTSLPTEGGWV